MVNERKEKQILWLSFGAGMAFAVAELLFSIFSHSQSVLMDAVYDATELVFIMLILFLTPLFYKPVTEKHPYGFFQIESIFLIIKGFMMISVSLSVAVEILESAFSGGNPVNSWQISLFQLVLGLVSMAIYFIMRKMNENLSSPTVDAELLGWKTDIAYSGGLSVAFFLSMFLDKTPLAFLAPYFDPLVAVAVMVMMLPESVKLLSGAIKDVFLFPPDEDTVNQIKGICDGILERYEFDPVFYDITRTGRHLWVSVYFEIQDRALDVRDLKSAEAVVTRAVGEEFDNCSCELILSV